MEARIIRGSVYAVRYSVGGVLQPRLCVECNHPSGADAAVLLEVGSNPEHHGREVRVLSVAEIDPDAL